MTTQIKVIHRKVGDTYAVNEFLKEIKNRLISIQTVIVWGGYEGWVQITTIYYFQEEQS